MFIGFKDLQAAALEIPKEMDKYSDSYYLPKLYQHEINKLIIKEQHQGCNKMHEPSFKIKRKKERIEKNHRRLIHHRIV